MPAASGKPELELHIEAEYANFEISRKALGKTYGLVENFRSCYDSLAGIVGLPDGGAVTEESTVTAVVFHLLLTSRRQFVIGILAIMRAYRSDAMLHLRRAIEACAFAARIRLHPHLAKVWLDSSAGDVEYDRYRDKFKKLFPAGDPLLKQLETRYDRCSKQMHSSVHGSAGYFAYAAEGQVNLNLFDLPPDQLVPTIFFTFDTHRRILRLFARSLRPTLAENVDVWEVEMNSVESKLDEYREEWKAVLRP